MIMLEELCLGHYYFETAVLLRESVFLNGSLTNIEVCYGLTKENINTLETLDKILLRKILSSHSKVCSPSIWLELGLVPIRFLVMGRRVNFLYYILNRPDHDLLKKVFIVQEKYPVKNDWTLTVKQDLEDLDIKLSFDEIKSLKKETFSKIVKDKVRTLAFRKLMEEKNTYSKMEKLQYTELKMQNYFVSHKINTKTAQNIYCYRTRMAGVKVNFRSQFQDIRKIVRNIYCII